MYIVTYMPFKKQEDANKYQKNYYDKNHEQCLKIVRKSARKRMMEIKKEIYNLLGNKCANPYNLNHGDFLADIRCLQIDHINGGGNKERNKIKNYISFYLNILKQIKAGSKDYQLLCANCNWIKRNINNENPQTLNS